MKQYANTDLSDEVKKLIWREIKNLPRPSRNLAATFSMSPQHFTQFFVIFELAKEFVSLITKIFQNCLIGSKQSVSTALIISENKTKTSLFH